MCEKQWSIAVDELAMWHYHFVQPLPGRSPHQLTRLEVCFQQHCTHTQWRAQTTVYRSGTTRSQGNISDLILS